MPNHCHNRVTFILLTQKLWPSSSRYSRTRTALVRSYQNQTGLTHQLMSKDVQEYSFSEPRGKVGELPQYVDTQYGKSLRFRSTDQIDDRWYDWRLCNWDTKWDAYDVVVTDDDPESVEIEFNTAWSPPEAICNQIREDYPAVSVSWFYDEPGCEIAGYL